MNAPQSRALGELLGEIAARRPKRPALVFKVMQRKLPEQVLLQLPGRSIAPTGPSHA